MCMPRQLKTQVSLYSHSFQAKLGSQHCWQHFSTTVFNNHFKVILLSNPWPLSNNLYLLTLQHMTLLPVSQRKYKPLETELLDPPDGKLLWGFCIHFIPSTCNAGDSLPSVLPCVLWTLHTANSSGTLNSPHVSHVSLIFKFFSLLDFPSHI